MFGRLAATLFAGVLVMVPPLRAGVDVRHQAPGGSPFAAASAGVPADGGDATIRRAALLGRLPAADKAARDAMGDAPLADDVAADLANVARFGFGAHTGFYPTEQARELILSFDDGPDLKFTPLVLDELDRRGLKAIFFVTGHRVVGDHPEDLARRELLGRIAAHGHMVANHTMTHANLCRSPEDAAAEIDENAEVITQATGVRPLLFRAPYGARCRSLEAELVARQLVSVGWNLDPQDWKNPTSADILRYLQARLSRLQGRGILLLHDTHAASVFALAPLLDWIARENRLAVQEGRAPIALRDYGVFLPERPLPGTGIATVAASVLDNVTAAIVRLGPSRLGR